MSGLEAESDLVDRLDFILQSLRVDAENCLRTIKSLMPVHHLPPITIPVVRSLFQYNIEDNPLAISQLRVLRRGLVLVGYDGQILLDCSFSDF